MNLFSILIMWIVNTLYWIYSRKEKVSIHFAFNEVREARLIIIYFLTIFFVIFLLFSVNTIYSLMSLAGIIFCTFLVLLTAGFEFFALIYLLIYIGAIIVFFLFSIMLLHLKFERIFDFEISHATAMFTFVSLNVIIWNLTIEMRTLNLEDTEMHSMMELRCSTSGCIPSYGNRIYHGFFFDRDWETAHQHLEPIGIALFNQHGFLCFVIGFILLITMFGSMQLIQYSKRLQKVFPDEGTFEDTIVL